MTIQATTDTLWERRCATSPLSGGASKPEASTRRSRPSAGIRSSAGGSLQVSEGLSVT